MNELNATMAWENLRLAISDIENPKGDWNVKLATMEAGVQILLDFSPSEIVELAMASDLPARAVVSWLVFEASRLDGVDSAKAQALKDYWDSQAPEGQKVMSAPQGINFF